MFTNIKTKPVYDIQLGITSEKSIKKVNIDGSNKYKKGDIVLKDVKVVVYYHMSADKDPNKDKTTTSDSSNTNNSSTTTTQKTAYYHSSNDINTASQGTSGVYAYVKKGKEMDSYIIIDLDEKAVYNFQERNNDNTGLKTNNISGDLKNDLSVTWIFPDSSGTEHMHFNRSNPETLEFIDNDGFKYYWEAANYSKAIEYKNKKQFTTY